MNDRRFLGLTAGGRRFALPADRVRRVVAAPLLSPPPAPPAALAGFFSCDGALVCVLKLCALLDLPCAAAPGLYDHVLLLRAVEPATALLVDRVEALFAPDGSAAAPVPPGLSHRDCIVGQVGRGGDLAPVIDVDRLISEFEREAVAHFLAEEERRRGALAEAAQ